jgi:hypothetical protein
MDFTQRVVRIPIAGPEPFNTLVVVRETVASGPLWPYGFHRSTPEYKTSFVLSGFQPGPDADNPCKHSTSLVMYHLDLGNDTSFLAAFDEVKEAGFDPSGTWVVRVQAAVSIDRSLIGSNWLRTFAQISSWVLCNEPRPQDTNDRDERFQQRLGDERSHVHAYG